MNYNECHQRYALTNSSSGDDKYQVYKRLQWISEKCFENDLTVLVGDPGFKVEMGNTMYKDDMG